MQQSVPPHASQNLNRSAAVEDGQTGSPPGVRVAALPGVLFKNLSRSQRREIERRQRILTAHGALMEKGLSREQAARELRVGIATLWRYRKRIQPLTANCGRKSTIEKFNPPARLLSLVRQLQLGGMSNADAWRAAANDSTCPRELAEYLKSIGCISPSLLRATKLIRKKVTVLEAPGILVLKQ